MVSLLLCIFFKCTPAPQPKEEIAIFADTAFWWEELLYFGNITWAFGQVLSKNVNPLAWDFPYSPCLCNVENIASLTLRFKIMTHAWLLTRLLRGKDDASLRGSLGWMLVSSSCAEYYTSVVRKAHTEMLFVRTFLWQNSSSSGGRRDLLYVSSPRLHIRLWSYLFGQRPEMGGFYFRLCLKLLCNVVRCLISLCPSILQWQIALLLA